MASRDSTEQAASDTEPTAIQDGNDYDGRDLREVVRQPGIEWPKDWPPQDHIPKIELGPVTLLSTDSANVLPADDFVAFKMGLRSVGMLTGTDVPLRKLANYTHFASVKEMLFYVHTIGTLTPPPPLYNSTSRVQACRNRISNLVRYPVSKIPDYRDRPVIYGLPLRNQISNRGWIFGS